MMTDEQKKYYREYQKVRREYLKKVKRCIFCQRQDSNTFNGHSLCLKCLTEQNTRNKIYYYRNKLNLNSDISQNVSD